MNKKVLLLLVFLSGIFWLIVNTSYAQYTEADMRAVTVRFCSETWVSTHDAVYVVEPGKDTNIRLCVYNGWDKEVSFDYGFSESGIWKGRYCQANNGTGNKFSLLIPSTKPRNITIGPMTGQTIEEKIVIPPGMSGLQLGCLGYNLWVPENKLVWWMFALKIRKVWYIDIMIGWESTVKSSIKVLDTTWGIFSTNKKVKAEIDAQNRLKLSFLIENQGNISQNITITGTINNMLAFEKEFSISQTITPGSTSNFNVDAGMLPVYKWLYSINFNVQNTPQFVFPIANEKLKQPWYISGTASIFIFSRIRIVVLVILLLILYKLFAPRRSKVAAV